MKDGHLHTAKFSRIKNTNELLQQAAVISQQLPEEELLGRFDGLLARLMKQNAGYSEAEVTADIGLARRERVM